MPIPLFLLERIRSSAMNGQHIADYLAQMAAAADETGINKCAITLEYVLDDDTILPDDLIPTVTFALSRKTHRLGIRPMDPNTIAVPNPFDLPEENP